MPAAHVHRDDDPLGELLDGACHERGIERRRRAQDRAGRAEVDRVLHRLQRPHAPAQLHGEHHRLADVPDHVAVLARVEGGVQVDDVQAPRALLLEAHRDLHRVIGVARLLSGVAAHQADGPTPAEVDRGG